MTKVNCNATVTSLFYSLSTSKVLNFLRLPDLRLHLPDVRLQLGVPHLQIPDPLLDLRVFVVGDLKLDLLV